MKSVTALLALLGAASANVLGTREMSSAMSHRRRAFAACPEPRAEFLQLSDKIAAEERNQTAAGLTKRAPVTINMHVHVVSVGKNLEDGWVTDKNIAEQVDVMNEAFKPYDFQFKLVGTDRQVDSDLSIVKSDDLTDLLGNQYRKGDYSTLNLYVVKDMPGDVAGDCSLPIDPPGPGNSEFDYKYDGCRFTFDTLPGISGRGRVGNGKVVVHEVGHWLGLLHTFQEGEGASCDVPATGDSVDDTPVHLQDTSPFSDITCSVKDSCPQDGTDPVHNYMNYVDEQCWTEFTPGQVKRMRSFWDVRTSVKS